MIMDYLQHLAEWATEGVLALVVIGQIRLWLAHFKLREEMAKEYVKKDEVVKSFEKVDVQMDELRKTTTRILELVAEIRGRSNVHGISG
jgi:hypothetical protein